MEWSEHTIQPFLGLALGLANGLIFFGGGRGAGGDGGARSSICRWYGVAISESDDHMNKIKNGRLTV